jgi:prepilin-type N-terminal cleavage/methylation domain-containing protein
MFRYLKLGISTRCHQNKGENGFSLIEVLIAVSILSLVSVAFLYGISTALRANNTSETQSKALSLAESQLESVKGETYKDAPYGGEASYTKINSGSYTISSINHSNSTVDDVVYGVPTSTDAELQKITVIIKRGGSEILRLSTFKVNLEP